MSLQTPAQGWFQKPVAKDERMWMVISLLLCIMLFVWMILWHVYGKQNPSNVTYRTNTKEYAQLAEAYMKKHMMGVDNGVPVVKPEPNSDVFVMGEMWRWSPALILKKDERYNIHISSKDLMHGFSIQPINMNFQIYPGYDYVLHFTPTSAGEYKIVCNEFCGIGHHTMIGKIVVIESDADLAKYGYDKLKAPVVAKKDSDGAAAPKTEADMIAAGEQLYTLKGCVACHKTDGSTLLAPAWNGLFGKSETITEDGATKDVTVDEAYIKESILTPQKKITKGFDKLLMPVLAMSDEEIDQLTAFIKSLK
jgi:cytochrome c oxidase subunit 2